MPRRRLRTPVEELQLFEWGRIISLREAGWTYRRIAAHVGHNVSVVCRCFQQWSVEHSHTQRLGSGRPRITDASHDRRIVQSAVVARTVIRKEIRAHVAPIGTVCLQQDSDQVPLARVPLTPRHREARLLWCRERVYWRVE